MSGVNGSMNSHTIYQHDLDLNNGDVSCVNVFINSHTLSPYNESSSFYVMDRDVETGDVSGGHGYINSQTIYQNNGLSSLINSNNSYDIEMNGYLKNGDVSCGNGFINIHTLSRYQLSAPVVDRCT